MNDWKETLKKLKDSLPKEVKEKPIAMSRKPVEVRVSKTIIRRRKRK